MKKVIRISILVVVLILAIVIWWRYFFVFSEGVKAGDLNYFEKKGVLFKTYEGRLVQAGFQSPTPGGLQSNEFRFSVADEAIAKKLERASGSYIEVRYKEYFAPLAWRGAAKYVVIEVLEVQDNRRIKEIPIQ
jgi:hypothetical protein